MWPFQKKEDFVVFIPQPKSKFNILRIDTKIDQATLETRIAHTGELKDKSFAEVA